MLKKNIKVQIPKFLGLQSIKPKRKGTYELAFGFSPQTKTVIQVDVEMLEFLSNCLAPISLKELACKLKIKQKDASDICRVLIKEGILTVVMDTPVQLERYSRHSLFFAMNGVNPVEAQKKICKQRIALIGMGGIGNWVALNMIGVGFKELRFIDFDKIELSNLTRQVLFNEEDIGKLKTEVAANVLSPKNNQTKISTVHLEITNPEALEKSLKNIDVVVLSADRPESIHDWVDMVCVKHNIPYINLGYRDGIGIVGPLTVPGQTSCYQCYKKKSSEIEQEELKLKSIDHDLVNLFHNKMDRHYQAPSFGPLNSLVSSIGVLEIIKYITGIGNCESFSTELAIDPVFINITKTNYERDTKCWHCSRKPKRKK